MHTPELTSVIIEKIRNKRFIVFTRLPKLFTLKQSKQRNNRFNILSVSDAHSFLKLVINKYARKQKPHHLYLDTPYANFCPSIGPNNQDNYSSHFSIPTLTQDGVNIFEKTSHVLLTYLIRNRRAQLSPRACNTYQFQLP